jgi:uracil-DNA glycosylase
MRLWAYGNRAMIKPVQKRMLAESSMGSAADFFPQKMTLPALKRAAGGCQACPLYRDARQTEFGQGPADAPLMLGIATGTKVVATHHPAAVLRAPDESARHHMRQELAADLSTAASLLGQND